MGLTSRYRFLVSLFSKFFIIFFVRNASSESISKTTESDSSSMALVPYSPPKTFGDFHKSERNFTFAGRTLTIHQDWENVGVAAVVWDAAIVLSRYLESKGDWINGKTVIELGAGTGLVGMVAAMLGGEVLVTDREITLKCMNINMDNNIKALSNTSLKVAELDWGQDISKFSTPYEVILGADIVYIEDTFQDLLKTLIDLSGTESVILLSCRIRYERDNKFLRLLKTKFSVKKILYDRDVDIEVYEARKLDTTSTKYEL